MNEAQVQEALYGQHTRSGQVGLLPPTCDPGTGFQDDYREWKLKWASLWMDWDSVVWFPEGRSISVGTP